MEGMTNTIVIQGRLGDKPRRKAGENGTNLFFTIASSDDRGATTWIDVAVFPRFEKATEVAETLLKGDQVTVFGKLSNPPDEQLTVIGDDGQAKQTKRRRFNIIADEVELDERAADREAPAETSREVLLARLVTR